jgi:solute carrier family 40 (iron-regulated transporter), member 1
MANLNGSPQGLFKSPSGPFEWQEADSLLPQTPIQSGSFELSGYPVGDSRRARQALYVSHFLSTWGQRAWEFLVGLVMLEIHPSSLLLVSIFGLCDAAAVVIFGPAVGTFVDSMPRLKAASTMYIIQNTAVAVSAASCLTLVFKWGTLANTSAAAAATSPHHGVAYWIFVVIAMVTGSISSIGALGATLSVEREWTKTLSGTDSDALAAMNAVMKRIDLACLIASPIGVGLLMTYRIDAAIIGVLVWNVAAWIPECSLLKRAQMASPVLSASRIFPDIGYANRNYTNSNSTTNGANLVSSTSPSEQTNKLFSSWTSLKLITRLKTQLSGWAAYIQQPAAPAALSLALLYLTVMSFGTLMTAYLKWSGLKEAELSIYRGFGALSGIGATLVFPFLHRKWGLLPTGVAAIRTQLVCLVLAATPAIVLGTKTTSTSPGGENIGQESADGSSSSASVRRLLVFGLILSRFGLWGFDLAVNQIIQETVPSVHLGAVNGVQGSLQSLFQMLAYVAGVVIWRPDQFSFLMAGSVAAVGAAAVLFTLYGLRFRFNHMNVVAVASSEPAVLTP